MKMRGRKTPKWNARDVLAALAVGLSGGAALTQGIRPVPVAMLCAALCAGTHPAWGLLGGVLAGLMGQSWALPAACALCAALLWPFRRLNPELRAALSAAAGGCACAWAGGADWAATAGSGALALALSPLMVCGWQAASTRHVLSPEEKLSLAISAAGGLIGLSARPAGRLLGLGVSAFLTFRSSREGSAPGALSGLLSGACTLGPTGAAVLGLAGGAAGVLRGLHPFLSALGMGAAMALWSMLTGQWDGGLLCACGAGMLAAAALPPSRARLVTLWARPFQNSGDRRRLIAARKSVSAMGEALMECARACQQAGEVEGGNSIVSVMRERLCEGCADYARCWQGGAPEAGRLFTYLSARLLSGGPLDPLPPDQVRFCRRSPHMLRRLSGIFAAAEQRRSAQRERVLAARMSAAPLQRAAGLLMDLEKTMGRGGEDVCAAQKAQAAMDKWGEEGLWSASAGRDMALELCSGTPIRADRVKQAAGLFSQALGGRYTAVRPDRYVRDTAIHVSAGAYSREASPGSPCGDRALCADLGDGRTALILSDGMGRGADAAGESRCVVTLLHRLLLAGAQARSAVDAVNSMMRLRDGDRFATLDLCLIDAYRREAAFYKLGASLSVLMRRGVCLRVEGGRLPPGVVDAAQPSVTTLRLRPGDAVVMVTDGVADFARDGQEDWLTRTLPTLPAAAPASLARRVVEASVLRDGGRPSDDMTAVCALIRE